jgi:hypothetical protein
MSGRLNLMIALFAVAVAMNTGCGSKSPGNGQPTVAAETKVAAGGASTGAASGVPADSALACMLSAAPGIDYQGNSSGYLFIGDHPACTSATDLQKFCAAMRTRPIYEKLEEADLAGEGAGEVAASLPEEVRADFLAALPWRTFGRSSWPKRTRP